MSRWCDPTKWQSPSFRKLKPAEKLIVFYINDVCNNAGFLEFDPEDCSFRTKMTEDQVNEAYKNIQHLIDTSSTHWIYIKGFLKEQRNIPLKANVNAHLQIIRMIVDMKDIFPEVYHELVKKPGLEKDMDKKNTYKAKTFNKPSVEQNGLMQ